MLVRKLWMLVFVMLLNCFVVPSACAEDIAAVIQKGVQDIITYLTSATTIQNQADAEMIFMAAPGTTEAAQNVGISAGVVESTLNNKLLPKELTDINWGLYATPRPDEQIKGDAINNFLENHKAFFCSPSSDVEKVLGTPLCLANTTAREHADLKVSSLLEPSIYDQSQKVLAEEVIRTLTTPFPNGNLKDMVSNGLAKASDKTYVAKIMSKHAMIHVARNSLNEIYGSRLAEVTPTVPPKAASIMSIMEEESGRRFKNKDWYDAVSQSSHEALLRELVHMESFRLWMDYYRYRQNERMEALLAVLAAQSADQSIQYIDSMPK